MPRLSLMLLLAIVLSLNLVGCGEEPESEADQVASTGESSPAIQKLLEGQGWDREVISSATGLQYVDLEVGEGEAPKRFLQGYEGYLQADAASVFDQLYLQGPVLEVACAAHMRRYFYKARLTAPREAHRAGFTARDHGTARELEGTQLLARPADRDDLRVRGRVVGRNHQVRALGDDLSVLRNHTPERTTPVRPHVLDRKLDRPPHERCILLCGIGGQD